MTGILPALQRLTPLKQKQTFLSRNRRRRMAYPIGTAKRLLPRALATQLATIN